MGELGWSESVCKLNRLVNPTRAAGKTEEALLEMLIVAEGTFLQFNYEQPLRARGLASHKAVNAGLVKYANFILADGLVCTLNETV